MKFVQQHCWVTYFDQTKCNFSSIIWILWPFSMNLSGFDKFRKKILANNTSKNGQESCLTFLRGILWEQFFLLLVLDKSTQIARFIQNGTESKNMIPLFVLSIEIQSLLSTYTPQCRVGKNCSHIPNYQNVIQCHCQVY